MMDACGVPVAYLWRWKMPSLSKRVVAESMGTFWLVLGGCGAAVLAGDVIGVAGIALAFGLTVLTMAYAIGHISGCHLNPAVSIGLAVAGRFDRRELPAYIGAQLVGGLVAIGILYLILTGVDGFKVADHRFASNHFAGRSPNGFSTVSALVTEVVLTFMFVTVILGATDGRAPAGFAPIAIGLCLTLVHLIGIPVTNLSVNPARSTAPALFEGMEAIKQLWLFWVAPIGGAALAGLFYSRFMAEE